MNEQSKYNYLNRNIKLYPMYGAFIWDLFFVWTIMTLFLTNVKGLSNSQVVLLDSIQMGISFLLCIPISKLCHKLSSVVASRIAQISYALFLIITMLGETYAVFVVARILLAIGYILNSVKGEQILNLSLLQVNRRNDYGKISGKSFSNYYLFDAIGAVVITMIYGWNPYACFIISLVVVVFSILYSFLFKTPEKFMATNVDIKQPINTKQKKSDGYFKILSSGFVISLLLFLVIMRGALSISSNAAKIFLQMWTDSSKIPLWSFGVIYGIMKVCTALSSKYQFKYDLKFGVRSLIIFATFAILTPLTNGVVSLLYPNSYIGFVIVILSTFIQATLWIPCNIFVTNYIQVCMPQKNIEKLYTLKTMSGHLGYAIGSLIFSALMKGFNDSYALANIFYILILAIPLIISTLIFIRLLIKKYASKYTVIRPEYTEDD